MRRGPASPGCAYFLFSSSLVLLWTAMRADHAAPVARISRGHPGAYGKATGARLCPASCFFSCCLQENRGIEWVEPRARSLIAAGRLAMLAAVQGDNGARYAARRGGTL